MSAAPRSSVDESAVRIIVKQSLLRVGSYDTTHHEAGPTPPDLWELWDHTDTGDGDGRIATRAILAFLARCEGSRNQNAAGLEGLP